MNGNVLYLGDILSAEGGVIMQLADGIAIFVRQKNWLPCFEVHVKSFMVCGKGTYAMSVENVRKLESYDVCSQITI